MALTKAQLKEILSKAGCEVDSIDSAVQKILDGHIASVDALREERDNLKKELDQAKVDQKEMETLRKDSANVAALRKEYEDFKHDVENKEIRSRKESAYKEILKDVGVPEKHFSKILKYSDVDGLNFDADGKVVGADEIRKSIKEEWGDHIEQTSVTGTTTPTPPTNVSSGSSKSMQEIMSIKDTSARQAELAKVIQNQNSK